MVKANKSITKKSSRRQKSSQIFQKDAKNSPLFTTPYLALDVKIKYKYRSLL